MFQSSSGRDVFLLEMQTLSFPNEFLHLGHEFLLVYNPWPCTPPLPLLAAF